LPPFPEYTKGTGIKTDYASDIKLQHPVALYRADFAFCVFAVYVQRRLIFSRLFLFISAYPAIIKCTGYKFRPNRPSSGVQVTRVILTGHHHVYRLYVSA
jgi:hypothetical protein